MCSLNEIHLEGLEERCKPKLTSIRQERIRGELVRAAYKGDEERVASLLTAGGAANSRDANDFRKPPILQIAAACGHHDLVVTLLTRGADIDAVDKYGYTALHKASKEGHGQIVQLLLREGASLYVHGKSEDQMEVACRNGAYDVVESLINRGRRVDGRHLKAAYLAKRRDVAELLIRNGALTANARTNIHMICFLGLDHAFEIIVNADSLEAKDADAMTPIMVASRCGHLGLVKRCLSKGASIEICDVHKNTPLHHATLGGHEKIVRTLLQNAISIQNKDRKGRSALHLACLNNSFRVCETLLQYGANVNDLDIYGRAPLFYARGVNIATELLRFGADVNSRDSYSRTPLHVACEGKDTEDGVVDTLLAHGVSLNAVDWRGNMAPVNASANGRGGLVEKVLAFATTHKSQKVAREMIENLEAALLQNMGLLKNMKIVDALLRCGVNLDTSDEQDRTPLFKAIELYVDLMKDYPHLPTPEFLITDIRLYSFAGSRLDIIFSSDLLTHVYWVNEETLHYFLAMGCGTECALSQALIDDIVQKRDLRTLECLREFCYPLKQCLYAANVDNEILTTAFSAARLKSLCRHAIRRTLSTKIPNAGLGNQSEAAHGVRKLSSKIKGLVRGRFFKDGRTSSRLVIRSIPLSLIHQVPIPPRLQQYLSFEVNWCVP